MGEPIVGCELLYPRRVDAEHVRGLRRGLPVAAGVARWRQQRPVLVTNSDTASERTETGIVLSMPPRT